NSGRSVSYGIIDRHCAAICDGQTTCHGQRCTRLDIDGPSARHGERTVVGQRPTIGYGQPGTIGECAAVLDGERTVQRYSAGAELQRAIIVEHASIQELEYAGAGEAAARANGERPV